MTAFIASVNRLAEAWAQVIWVVTWQSTLLVAVFAMVALAMRRSSPSLRYWAWQIAAIKLLVMPLWGVSILIPGSSRSDAKANPEGRPVARSVGELGARPSDWRTRIDPSSLDLARAGQERWSRRWPGPLDWRAWLLIGWGLAVAGQVAAIVHQRKRLNAFLRQAEPATDPSLLSALAELSGQTGLSRQPEVRIGGDGLFVCGLRCPTLVLPRELARALDPASLRTVLLHELAHIKRRDLLWEWVPAIARLLYFFHPAAHYIVYRARLERELACDQAAMVLTDQTAARYASTLVEVVTWSSQPHALQAALASARLDGASFCPPSGNAIEITCS
jgi:beta-lactamase regulating signal transducer with metallopeptidase domain